MPLLTYSLYELKPLIRNADITEACEIADRLGLIRPAFDQSEYNLFKRSRVDSDFTDLYKKYNYGLTTFSPLASGLLTGKYKNGLPADSRLGSVWYKFMADVNIQRAAKAAELESIAEELGCTIAQLALAWCASNEHVSTVVFSATSVN
ncbi:hypothetical protein Poli38472_014561 [Pythium oligandrum]|uniref:NADP-dependent oxidoreductase domain-containing protein n=1 Tax=Pythium oligandrum TaxID=41045 RepID=A0A8K1FJZ7_PYTOL|nr:hypothetical protein Poli38472_014561 [Pythium oligandrum]|eukprot:TMW66585.1 hypothetical protein Poli38472_014561 [Pythium oligandrum]